MVKGWDIKAILAGMDSDPLWLYLRSKQDMGLVEDLCQRTPRYNKSGVRCTFQTTVATLAKVIYPYLKSKRQERCVEVWCYKPDGSIRWWSEERMRETADNNPKLTVEIEVEASKSE